MLPMNANEVASPHSWQAKAERITCSCMFYRSHLEGMHIKMTPTAVTEDKSAFVIVSLPSTEGMLVL